MEPLEGQMDGTSSPVDVSTKLQRIAKLAKESPGMGMTTLAHHIDVAFLREAHRRTRKDGAAGIDRRTAADYSENLEGHLEDLLGRFKSGRYRAPAVRRVHIPKGNGKTRPIGIPTFEDKVLQRAVTMVLEAVYEQDFMDCSYGFRPGRSAHQALEAVWEGLTAMRGGWVLEVDIESFFDHLDHGHLRDFLGQRARDGVLRRAIDKWLKAGVLEGGELKRSATGTPQGGVVSPLLANVYLHHVLDSWFESAVRPRLRGQVFLVRYADDVVIAFEREDDAYRVMEVLPKRFGKYGLTLHPEKTRLVRFPQPPYRWRAGRRGNSKALDFERPGTFDLLGFTHFWGQARRGGWALFRKTAASRFRRAVRAVYEWLRAHRHWSVAEQHRALSRKLRGHWAYYGITGNFRRLCAFRRVVIRAWQKWLNRRSRGNTMPWSRFNRLLARYPLPRAQVVHSVFRRAANPSS
jgi:group II intron reverse transcriptase/maturase